MTEMLIEVSLSFLKEEFKDAPWKLNIETLLMQLWEGNSKGKLLIKKGKIQFLAKNFFYEPA